MILRMADKTTVGLLGPKKIKNLTADDSRQPRFPKEVTASSLRFILRLFCGC